MNRQKWILLKLLRGKPTTNVCFADLRTSLKHLDFEEHIRGSHHLYRRPDLNLHLNLQKDGGKAKPYQVRQVRNLISRLNPGTGKDDA